MIEVVIAVIILAVLAAMIVPRMSRTTKAEHENAVAQLLDLLSMYAFRDATSSQQIALWQDPETGWITLLASTRDPSATTTDGERSRFEWAADERIIPVALPRGMELTELAIDGRVVTGTDWLAATVPGGGRPTIEMRIVSGSIDTVLRLDSNTLVPQRTDAGSVPNSFRESVDLDEVTSRGERW
ncbi:MAG: hypothetical protein EXS15_03420 [Phycisphaerales bacterium]|nr:hypothetical protein [Phycisphaerales bacterium]